MTFKRAFNQMKLGKRVRRDSWAEDIYVYVKEPRCMTAELVIRYADGTERQLQEHVITAWGQSTARYYKDWRVYVK